MSNVFGLEPFDKNDPFNRLCEKYRKQFLSRAMRTLKDRQEEFEAFLVGSFTGIAEAMIAAGADPVKLEEWLKDMSEFSIAQATRGAVIPAGYATKYGVGGSA